MATKCPRCFQPMPDDLFTWMSTLPGETEEDPAASAFAGGPVSSGRIERFRRLPSAPPGSIPGDDVVGQRFGGGPAVEVCPVCHYQLPPGWRLGQATCIAMAGARATGKTVYLAVLIKQLQQLGELLGHVVEPATGRTDINYREHYEAPLFEQRGILESTPATETGTSYQRDPLIFRLGVIGGVPRYLVLRDVAGEDLENPANASMPWLQFFRDADGVVFMFDPLKVDEIQDQLFDLIPAQERVGGDPLAVLRTVRHIIGDGTPRLAVVLSKFDALQALRDVEGSEWSRIMANPGAGFARDLSIARAPYDENDGILVHEEVRSLLQRFEAQQLVMAVEGGTPPGGSRYFAVSALGQSPTGDKLHSNGISPFRCADPVRWILRENGVW